MLVWQELGLFQLLVIGAAIACVDAALGVSQSIAERLKRPRLDGQILLVLTIIVGLLVVRVLHASSISPIPLVNYSDPEDALAAMTARDQRADALNRARFYVNLIYCGLVTFTIGSMLLAIRKRQSVVLWIPLSILCNVGGIAWLLARRRRPIAANAKRLSINAYFTLPNEPAKTAAAGTSVRGATSKVSSRGAIV